MSLDIVYLLIESAKELLATSFDSIHNK